MKPIKQLLPALAVMVLASVAGHGADMSVSLTAPIIDGADIANYGTVTGSDKWWPENSGAGSTKGQTFTTGALKVRLLAITYQVASTQQAQPTKTYTVRVGTTEGNLFTELHSENFVQDFYWPGGGYMTWRFTTPVLLEANTTYGIDVGITSSTTGWTTGIPYINMTGNNYAGGNRYTSGTSGIGTPQIVNDTSRDRIFHLDLEYPPQGFQFILE